MKSWPIFNRFLQCIKSHLTPEQTSSRMAKRLDTDASDLQVKSNRLLAANGDNLVVDPIETKLV